MSYNPTITSARRAAKLMSKQSGTPYQASLDAVARLAGRADWNEYLSSPVDIPQASPRDADGLYVDGPEHLSNQRGILIAGLATLPSLMALPFALGGLDRAPANADGFTRAWSTIVWGIQTLHIMPMMWICATLGGMMFFDLLERHPNVPEAGENARKSQNTSRDLAVTSCTILLGATIVAIVAWITKSASRVPFEATMAISVAGLIAGGVSLAVRGRTTRRVLALVSANAMAATTFLAIGSLGAA